MANALIVDAPPMMFEDFAAILEASEFECTQSSFDSLTRGIRRKDSATYEVSHGSTRVDVVLERRLGDQSMFIAVIPIRNAFWRRENSSDQFAQRIMELLVANGADDKV